MAIENLDYLRQLIEEVRQDPQYMDMLRLRMLQDLGVGTDRVEADQ
jgi:hypothetical protein